MKRILHAEESDSRHRDMFFLKIQNHQNASLKTNDWIADAGENWDKEFDKEISGFGIRQLRGLAFSSRLSSYDNAEWNFAQLQVSAF